MINFIKCLFTGKRILETEGYFVAQVYEFGVGWCGIDKRFMTWATRENIMNKCVHRTCQEANDRLLNYIEWRKEQKERSKKKVHLTEPVPRFWRLLRNKQEQ